MTRILVQRGSSGSSSSSSQNRPSASSSWTSSSSSSSSSSVSTQAQVSTNSQVVSDAKDDEGREEVPEQPAVDEFREDSVTVCSKGVKSDDLAPESMKGDQSDDNGITDTEKVGNDDFVGSGGVITEFPGLSIVDEENEGLVACSLQPTTGRSCPPPPPPVPPPKAPSSISSLRRSTSGSLNAVRIGSSRRAALWPPVSTRTSPTGSQPSSPRSHSETEGYNSADEQGPCVGPTYNDAERERKFEIDIRRVKGWEVKKMLEDGNCLFRAVADQVYGDSEAYGPVRQMCVEYMERERDHFSQFITEGFTSYCKRKRRDKVYGNNVEIQALSEMYNRPIHIYSYSTEPINIFHGGYTTDLPPIRLSYHHGNHYNSLVDPHQLTIGAGLGFGCLKGTNVNQDQVKAAIRAQQDQQIDNALLAEGRFYSDIELTEKEIERMVMEASRAEYINNTYKQQLSHRDSSTSGAEPSSSAARSSGSENRQDGNHNFGLPGSVLNSSMQSVLSMGFSYMRAVEAYSIFGDDVDSMICYLLETGSSSRRKGKATE